MEDKLSLKEKIVETQFELLKEHIGKRVTVEHYENGNLYVDSYIIKDVRDYNGVSFDIMFMCFLGNNCAIKRISFNGKVLYEANGLPEPYGYYDNYELIEIIRRVFGPIQAEKRQKLIQKIEQIEREDEQREREYVLKFQKEELSRILIQVKPFIHEELYEEWKNKCIKNSNSHLGISIIKMVTEILIAINNGMTYEEAMKTVGLKYGSSGYSDGIVAREISKYAKIGEEFKRYWNGKFTSSEVNGVINPAIIHIRH